MAGSRSFFGLILAKPIEFSCFQLSSVYDSEASDRWPKKLSKPWARSRILLCHHPLTAPIWIPCTRCF